MVILILDLPQMNKPPVKKQELVLYRGGDVEIGDTLVGTWSPQRSAAELIAERRNLGLTATDLPSEPRIYAPLSTEVKTIIADTLRQNLWVTKTMSDGYPSVAQNDPETLAELILTALSKTTTTEQLATDLTELDRAHKISGNSQGGYDCKCGNRWDWQKTEKENADHHVALTQAEQLKKKGWVKIAH